MTRELIFSATRKDFDVDWFSGTGGGGQHRNKHQNCCRITHRPTGIRAQSTEYKSREQNKRAAFKVVAKRLVAHVKSTMDDGVGHTRQEETIRTYHAVRGTAKDHRTKLVRPLQATLDGDLDEFITAMIERQLIQNDTQ
jgi:protein subunit release factor A